MEEKKKISFFKRFITAIKDVDKYIDFAGEKVTTSIKYMLTLITIGSLIIAIILTPRYMKVINNAVQYIANNSSSFEIKNGEIKVDSQQENSEPIIVEDSNLELGKVIIDSTKTSDEAINNYEKEFKDSDKMVLVFKDNIYIKNKKLNLSDKYSFGDITSMTQEGAINSDNVKDIAQKDAMSRMNMTYFFMMFLLMLATYFRMLFMDSLIFGLIAYVTARLSGMRLKYSVSYNIAIYSLTLPVLLSFVYHVLTICTSITVSYFLIVYSTIAYIYIVASLLIIKSDIIKHQIQLAKIIEEQGKVREEAEKELEEQEKREKEKEKEEKQEKKSGKKKKKDSKDDEGSVLDNGNPELKGSESVVEDK